MATVVLMPQLSISMTEGTIEKWMKKEGEPVQKGEVLLSILTDKVSMDYESPAAGILRKIFRAENEKVTVLDPIGIIGSWEEDITSFIPAGRDPLAMPEPRVQNVMANVSREKIRIVASPLAKKMAQEYDIDLSLVQGTGPGGKIEKEDVLRAIRQKEHPESKEKEGARSAGKETLDKEILETLPISGMRRVILENMQMSLQRTAQLTLHTEAGAAGFIELRNRLNESQGDKGTPYSYNALLVKAAASALRLHPRINASVAGEAIKIWRAVNIGMAMDSANGLVVPVIRNADQKPISEVNQELEHLIRKVKEQRLVPEDLAGGTFTISNLGFADVDFFTPILRPPESALLGVGRIMERPVVKNGEIRAEARMGLSLTFDHRIIDGAPAARFLKTVKDIIEAPSSYF